MSGPAVDEFDGTTVFPSPTPEHNDTFLDTGVGNMAMRAAFLALFIIIGFVGNCVLVATIAQSQRLKVFKLNLFILSVAIVNLINCIVNMPLILGNAITEKWDYGDFVCRFNAFTIQLTSIATLLGLLLMTLDRFLAVRLNNVERYTSLMTPLRANILIVYSWLHAFGFSVPLIFGIIPVKAFPARYLCAIDSGAPLLYLGLCSAFGFLLPILVMFSFFIYIIKTSVQERMRKQIHRQSYSQDSEDEPQIWTEINTAKYVGVVMILWCICEGPYLLLTAIEQYKNSSIIQNSGINLDFEYPWELDLSFTWLKLSYAIILPIVTLFWQKEVWQKFKNCVLCRKSNLVKDASSKKKNQRKREEARRKLTVPENNKVEMNSNGTFPVPVLFATPEGLHFQKYTRNDSEANETETDLEKGFDSTNGDSSVIATKCDVYGSQNFLDLEEGDTSDYDSEMDPFAGSNPISVHTKESLDNTNKDTAMVDILKSRDKGDIKLDDSGLEFSTNSKERDKENGKKKKVEKTEVEDVDQGIMIDDKNDHDSGRGSYGENSLKKKKRRSQATVLSEDSSPAVEANSQQPKIESQNTASNAVSKVQVETGSDNVQNSLQKKKKRRIANSTVEENATQEDSSIVESSESHSVSESPIVLPVDSVQSTLTKKKKKGKKKKAAAVGTDNPAVNSHDEPVGDKQEEWAEHKPIPAMRRPQPPRLNPIPKKDEYLEKISNAGDRDDQSEILFVSHRPLPEPPEKSRRHQRQVSEQPQASAPVEDSERSHTRSSSVPNDAEISETPKPAPRRTRNRSAVPEEEDSPREKPILKRKERKRTTSQSTNDSQTQLLQSSNTSTDLSDLQELNKVIAKKEVYGSVMPASQLSTPKPKKNKKKSQATDIKKSESKQELIDEPRV